MTSLSPIFKRVRPACGTWLELSVGTADREAADLAMTAAFALARRLESVFNRHDPASELARLNAAPADAWTRVSPDLAAVLHFGAELETRSEGAFRLSPECGHREPIDLSEAAVRRPCACAIDLGGIAKGYIVDRVFLDLERRFGSARILVNAGGDLRGSHAQQVELRIPSRETEIRYEVTIERGALATSARAESSLAGRPTARYAANPKGAVSDGPRGSASDGPRGPMSAAVFAASCLVADAMTKVALFGNPDARAFDDFPIGKVLRFSAAGAAL